MSRRTDLNSVPSTYPGWIRSECPQADHCLHREAYIELSKSQTYLHLMNPNMCRTDGKCPFYRNAEFETFARGFTRFKAHLTPVQYKAFMMKMISQVGRNPYFMRRRGELALPPREQQAIYAILRSVGVKEELEFDSYEQRKNWYW